ncbi:MAG: PDC sensor domain-containing protein, partial [Thioalkalispiraceae bacterium]
DPLKRAAQACSAVWGDRERLNQALTEVLQTMPYCKFLYALTSDAIQISDNISHEGVVTKDFGRDRSQRPYMNEVVPSSDFVLSDAYISLRAKRPSLTAIQIVRDKSGATLGFIGSDFDLRALPLTRDLYEEPRQWTQIKGDPSIRSNVFAQHRVDSEMDRHIDIVLGVIEELIVDHGVFNAKLHFSSNRAVIWHYDDPYRYRLLGIDSLIDPNICLAYPNRTYPNDATIPERQIRPILEGLRQLRYMDETLYLRAGALNIFNGIINLTFSCDGSHYLPYDEFLNKEHAFWSSTIDQ